MGNRRKARELAMQALFYMEMTESASEEKLSLFSRSRPASDAVLPFFLELVRGVVHSRDRIDAVIERFSSHWKVHRMSGVDRNLLRIAVYEMMVRDDIPAKVSINEAIEIGKKYGTEESGAFINGILDSIHLARERGEVALEPVQPDTAPIPPPEEDDDGPFGERRDEPPSFAPVKGRRGVVKRRTSSP
jgi:N utilization substance protein B